MKFEDSNLPDQPIIRRAFDVLHTVACAGDPRIADAFNAKAEIDHGVRLACYVEKYGWSTKPEMLAAALVKDLKALQVQNYMKAHLAELVGEEVCVMRGSETLAHAAHVFELEQLNGFFCAIANRAHLKDAFEGKAGTPWRVQRDADDHAEALAGAEKIPSAVEDAQKVAARTHVVMNTAKKIRTAEFCK